MPFQVKVQPIDSHVHAGATRLEPVKPVAKSRLKRLFERQFSSVLRNSESDKIGGEEPHLSKEGFNDSIDFEPSSVCLESMVKNFIEENPEKQSASARCGHNRCNCFNGKCDDSYDSESDAFGGFGEASETLKSLVACASVCESNLLEDTAKIVERNKICKQKDDFCQKIVTEGLLALGYDASICKSRWEKSPSCPAGEYEYIDVIIGNERLLIDIEFRSEFEIARPTKTYKILLQSLPYIFVGSCDRLQSIVAIVSEAAKRSLKKKDMHIPPWRTTEYIKAKWLSPYTRTTPPIPCSHGIREENKKQQLLMRSCGNGFELSRGEGNCAGEELDESMITSSESFEEDDKAEKVIQWNPPELKPKNSQPGIKVVTGLAADFDGNR